MKFYPVDPMFGNEPYLVVREDEQGDPQQGRRTVVAMVGSYRDAVAVCSGFGSQKGK